MGRIITFCMLINYYPINCNPLFWKIITVKNHYRWQFLFLNPQSDSIEEILNILSNANSEVSLESRNPLRIISGAIMIDKFESLIENLNQDLVNHNENILRILVHLSIFIAIIKPW